jgi:hypothetical protein
VVCCVPVLLVVQRLARFVREARSSGRKSAPSDFLRLYLEREYVGATTDASDNESQDAKLLAPEIAANGSLTKVSLAQNKLNEEGTRSICEALKVNKTLKELDLSSEFFSSDSSIGGQAGATQARG